MYLVNFMVSAKENQDLDNVQKPEPIDVKSVPACFQDGKTFRTSRFECIMCDFFDECKKARR